MELTGVAVIRCTEVHVHLLEADKHLFPRVEAFLTCPDPYDLMRAMGRETILELIEEMDSAHNQTWKPRICEIALEKEERDLKITDPKTGGDYEPIPRQL